MVCNQKRSNLFFEGRGREYNFNSDSTLERKCYLNPSFFSPKIMFTFFVYKGNMCCLWQLWKI